MANLAVFTTAVLLTTLSFTALLNASSASVKPTELIAVILAPGNGAHSPAVTLTPTIINNSTTSFPKNAIILSGNYSKPHNPAMNLTIWSTPRRRIFARPMMPTKYPMMYRRLPGQPNRRIKLLNMTTIATMLMAFKTSSTSRTPLSSTSTAITTVNNRVAGSTTTSTTTKSDPATTFTSMTTGMVTNFTEVTTTVGTTTNATTPTTTPLTTVATSTTIKTTAATTKVKQLINSLFTRTSSSSFAPTAKRSTFVPIKTTPRKPEQYEFFFIYESNGKNRSKTDFMLDFTPIESFRPKTTVKSTVKTTKTTKAPLVVEANKKVLPKLHFYKASDIIAKMLASSSGVGEQQLVVFPTSSMANEFSMNNNRKIKMELDGLQDPIVPPSSSPPPTKSTKPPPQRRPWKTYHKVPIESKPPRKSPLVLTSDGAVRGCGGKCWTRTYTSSLDDRLRRLSDSNSDQMLFYYSSLF